MLQGTPHVWTPERPLGNRHLDNLEMTNRIARLGHHGTAASRRNTGFWASLLFFGGMAAMDLENCEGCVATKVPGDLQLCGGLERLQVQHQFRPLQLP